MLGKLLDGRYQVTQILSSGGFGETFIAEDTRRPGNPRCVLKQLKPASSDPRYLEVARRLFNTEAEILEKLGNNDQIPRLLAYFEEGEEFHLVQELIVGHPLSAELTAGQRWGEAQVIQMLQDIFNVLEFVHSYGVIHRDIKPDNIIRRDADGKLVLIDFGAVKEIRTQMAMAESQVAPTVAIGTPGYMPAEQSQGRPRQNSDIYALGMIAIQALTGIYPAQLQTHPETGEVIWQDQAPHVSNRLAAILQRMVRYHYRDRYQTATEVLRDLQYLTQPLPPTQPDFSYSPASIPMTDAAANSANSFSQATATPQAATVPQPGMAASVAATPVESPVWIPKTLSVVKFVPFAGAAGLFLSTANTWVILLGVGLTAFGAGLFFLRTLSPKLARDYDAIFGVIFCLCGVLLIIQDDSIKKEIQMAQFFLASTGIFSACETICRRSEISP
jgi:serine/threonine-protein kinase